VLLRGGRIKLLFLFLGAADSTQAGKDNNENEKRSNGKEEPVRDIVIVLFHHLRCAEFWDGWNGSARGAS